MIRSRSVIASLAVAAAVTLAAVQPAGADPIAQARRHFRLGERHYAAGRYEAALTEYTSAYEASQLPGFLFNIGACHFELGHWAEAKDYLTRYVEAVPDAPNRADAERLVTEASGHLPPPPPPEPVLREPEPPPPEPVVEPPPPPSRSVRPATLVLLGAGGALAIAATVFAIDLGAAQSSLDDDGLDCTLRTARCHDLRDRGERDAIAQLVLGGAAAATLAAGGVLLALDLFAPVEHEDGPRVSLGPGRIVLEGRW